MSKSEAEREAVVLEVSSEDVTSEELNMREDFLNFDCQDEEVSTNEDRNSNGTNMHLLQDGKICEIVKGGLKTHHDVKNFLELMHDAKETCMRKSCLATLIAIEDMSIFERFLNDGGWDTLFDWLEESKEVEDVTFLSRLLDLYRLLPVTVKMLKQNACAKSIKHLIKSSNEVIGRRAKLIIDDWMLKVTLNKQKEHGSHKSKKSKFVGKPKSDDSEKSNDSCYQQSLPYIERPSSRKRCNSGSTDSLLSDVKITVKILPPKPRQPEPTSPQGFMNALSSANILPERKKVKTRRPSFTNNKKANNNNYKNGRDSVSISMDDDDDDDEEKTDTEDNFSGHEMTPLLPSEERKKRKTVSWAKESALCVYHYFPMDETERVNVNNMADFNEIRRHEIEMEHRMFQNSRRNLHNNLQPADQWRRPPFLTGVSYLVEPGCNSTERKTQMAREQKVLQVLYFNKRLLTDQPAEPDPEFVDTSEPKTIPLSDVTGTNSEVLYEHTTNIAQSSSTSSSSSSSSSSFLSSTSDQMMINNCDVPITPTQGQPPVTPSIPWGGMYNVPPPTVMTPMMDPQVIQAMMPPMIAPMYPPGFIPPPGFVHPPPQLPIPDFLVGYRHPMPHMSLVMPIPAFGVTANKPPCAHFLAGNCKFGSNCRFFHPPTSGSTTPTTQPSSTMT